MKRGIFFVFIILSFIIINQFIYAEIYEDSITGKATSQELGMSIFIQTVIPYIEITSPENSTYLMNESILLNYTLINGDYVWYQLDSFGNVTINSSVLLDVSQGTHTIHIFSNNTNATSTKSVTFTVNSNRFRILFDNYNGSTKGASTNFLDYNYREIQELDNIILENTMYGKIQFNRSINMTDDRNYTDDILDINSNVIMSYNSINLNSSELPNFNTSAIIWLYNLTFTTPRILKDGVVCPSTVCFEESYTGNTLKFNVTGFSIYSAEETPTTVPETPGGGGSGGGLIFLPEDIKFDLDIEEMLVYLKQGEVSTKYFTIENKENRKITFDIKSDGLEDFIKISDEKITLNPKESKIIPVDFLAREDALSDLYLGKIIITSESTEKEILVLFEIESSGPLFDVKMEIPNKFRYVLPGEEVFAEIEVYNLGDSERVDVFFDYIVKNSKGEEILFEQDSLAVETSANFLKGIEIPLNVPFGKYVFYVRANYANQTAIASVLFNVGRKSAIPVAAGIITFIIVLIVCIILVIFRIRKIKKEGNLTRRVDMTSPKIGRILRR